ARADNSVLSRWWWTVDRWTLAALAAIIAFGALLTMAATPAVAERLGLDSFYFVKRQLGLLPLALAVMLALSMLSPRDVRRVALVAFAGSVLLLCLLLRQPDVGMSLVVSAVWFAQFFLAGLRLFWVVLLGGAGASCAVGAYFIFPHVASRVNRFMD